MRAALRSGCRLLAVMLIAAAAPAAADTDPADERLAESRALVSRFAGELQSALKEALQTGGPVEAIAVCRDLAPQIGSRLSRQSGAAVGRISARYRNPLNAPSAVQKAVLAEFDAALTAEPGSAPEHFETRPGEGAQYLKAIPAAPLCLTCHGETLATQVAEQLGADYPHDLATGYRAGELRGAFSVLWPAP